MHLAAAAGVPGVALFGSTDAVATGPLGGRWVVLEEKMACSPCFQRNCRFTGGECRCLRAIPPERACAALEWLLAEQP
jgi:heptosyltransferase-2